jgi:hypothetical protein
MYSESTINTFKYYFVKIGFVIGGSWLIANIGKYYDDGLSNPVFSFVFPVLIMLFSCIPSFIVKFGYRGGLTTYFGGFVSSVGVLFIVRIIERKNEGSLSSSYLDFWPFYLPLFMGIIFLVISYILHRKREA